ncbi:MAG: FAD-dependent oxidoreductase, partial [Victivallales bacterium]|nr:FAD-dependent oxidoreductase [Victivallales bacterium]
AFSEKAREIPITAEVDVLVAGGGPAGFGAALTAARMGAKTLLIEQFNCVGGMATSGMMSHWSGALDSPILNDIYTLDPDQKKGIRHEALKLIMLEMLLDAGVEIRMYTQIVDSVKEGNRVVGVVTESKSGRKGVKAKVTIDCTGDGDVAARAGAEYVLGRESDNKCQPVTLMFRIGGVDYNKAVFPPSFETRIDLPKGEIQTLGKERLPFPAGHVLLYRTTLPNEVCVNMTNVIDVDATNTAELTRAEITCRRQMREIVAFLREFVPGYEECYVVAAAQNVGVRETRHFIGEYTITEKDVLEGRVFDDWIATRNRFGFDIHNVSGSGLDENGAQKKFKGKGAYTIPYRACLPKEIEGLLLAGRCISGTHKAHSSYRVMGICLNMGEGTGTAAALAVREDTLPRNVDVGEIQKNLKQQGVEV